MKIGVIADTHCPEFLPALPGAVALALDGVDLVLHCGDITSTAVLRELERIAPVYAVHGDHDRALDLPARRVVEAGGRRIGMIHGNRARLYEEPGTFLSTITLGHLVLEAGYDRWLRAQFPGVDVVVHGHTHRARIRQAGGQLIFCPGAVYQVDRGAAHDRLRRGPGWFEWSWLQVQRHNRRVPAPSVGILDLRPDRVEARIVPL